MAVIINWGTVVTYWGNYYTYVLNHFYLKNFNIFVKTIISDFVKHMYVCNCFRDIFNVTGFCLSEMFMYSSPGRWVSRYVT